MRIFPTIPRYAFHYFLLSSFLMMGLSTQAIAQAAKPVYKAEPPLPKKLEQPQGHVQIFSLHLSKFPVHATSRIRGAFRNNQYMIPGPLSLRQKAGMLHLNRDVIKGEFKWHSEDKGSGYDLTVKIRAKVNEDGSITGEWSAEGFSIARDKREKEKEKGAISGWIKSPESIAQSNQLNPKASWTSYMGSTHNLHGFPSDRELVDDLKEAKLIWRSEAAIPTGQGNAVPFGRRGMVHRAFHKRTIGSGAGPVLIDGKIYIYYQQPHMTGEFRKPHIDIMADHFIAKMKKKKLKNKKDILSDDIDPDFQLEEDGPEKLARDRAEALEKISPYAKEKYAIHSDEVLVCIDAVTGVTLWKATFPLAGKNEQDHKTGPVNLTPVVDEKQVYFTGTTGRVYALDRHSGELKWTAIMPTAENVSVNTQYTGNSHRYDDNFCQSPILVGELLLVPDHRYTLYAFDKASGKELWRKENAVGRVVTPLPWQKDGVDYVVTMRNIKDPKNLRETIGQEFMLLRVNDGKIMWRQAGTFSRAMTLSGDTLVILGESVDEIRKIKIAYADLYGFQISVDGAKQLWNSTFREAPFLSMNSMPLIVNDQVITTSKEGYRFLDLKTGATVKTLKEKGGSKMAFGVFANDRLITRIDSAHGGNDFCWIRNVTSNPSLSEGRKDRDGNHTWLWSPPHPTTNSYSSKPMMFLIADGRLYLRGADGLYCYDLRKP